MGLFQVLKEEKAVQTVLPSINLWLAYVLVFVILTAIYEWIVATLVIVLFEILVSRQSPKVKKAFHEWWYKDISPVSHLVLVVIEAGIFITLVKVIGFYKLFTDKGD